MEQNPSLPKTAVTEKNYPITKRWMLKAPLIFLFINIVALFFGYYFPYLVILIPIYLIANPFIRRNFHYSLDEAYFNVKQGVFSKKQRNIPYGVIQNVVVKQDLFDRIFGLATLYVENASFGGGVVSQKQARQALFAQRRQKQETVGASKNKVNIPGLKKKDAESLKMMILQKMKENPLEDTHSGL